MSEEKPLPTLDQVKERLIKKALNRTNGDVRLAAKAIDVGTTTIYRWIARFREREARQSQNGNDYIS